MRARADKGAVSRLQRVDEVSKQARHIALEIGIHPKAQVGLIDVAGANPLDAGAHRCRVPGAGLSRPQWPDPVAPSGGTARSAHERGEVVASGVQRGFAHDPQQRFVVPAAVVPPVSQNARVEAEVVANGHFVIGAPPGRRVGVAQPSEPAASDERTTRLASLAGRTRL